MKDYEFIGKLTLEDGLITGTSNKVPYDFIVGIPCRDGKFTPFYYIDQEYFSQIKDFTKIYEFIHALLNKDKKKLQEKLNILETIKIKEMKNDKECRKGKRTNR